MSKNKKQRKKNEMIPVFAGTDSVSDEKIKVKFSKNLFIPDFLNSIKNYDLGEFTEGNTISLLTNGDSCFNLFFKSIKEAVYSINLETYIFESDTIGWKIAKLLAEKARNGVEVNVMYDAFGCMSTSPDLFDLLKKSGVELVEFHPLMPWRKYWNISFRDHRKILIIDGKTAFLGGMNIGEDYAGVKLNGRNWRDTHLKIDGPAVRDIEFFFLENWLRQGGAMVNFHKHFPPLQKKGRNIIMVLSSTARNKSKPIQLAYLNAINNARESIYITNAYFIPDAKIYRSLVSAAGRGVDVRIILPGKSDIPVVRYAGRYLFKRYLKNNISIYEYQRSVLHAKTAVIDGIWATVGSANIDRRSFKKNKEVNALVIDENFGKEMTDTFMRDIEQSNKFSLENWEKRSVFIFIAEWIAYRFRNLL